jgi:TP901 family phage tail tape measure protein
MNPVINVIIRGVDLLTTKMQVITSKLDDFSRRAGMVGATLSASISAPLVMGLKKSVDTIANFEDRMTRLGYISQTVGTRAFDELKNKALELGMTTRFTSKEVVEAMEVMSKAGKSSSEILNNIKPVLDFSLLMENSPKEGANALLDVFAGYGINFSDTVEVNGEQVSVMSKMMDRLTTASYSAKVEISDMVETLKFASGVLSGTGADFDDVLTTFGLLGNKQYKGAIAGTVIRGAMSKLLKGTLTQEGIATLDKLKITPRSLFDSDASGKVTFKGFRNFIDAFHSAGATVQDMAKIFNEKQFAPLYHLIKDGVAEFDKVRDVFEGDSTGFASKVSKALSGGLLGHIKALTSAVEAFMLALGEAGLTKIIVNTLSALTQIVRMFASASHSVKQFIMILGGIGIVVPILLVLTAMITSLVSLISVIGLVTLKVVGIVVGAIAYLAILITGLVKVMKGETISALGSLVSLLTVIFTPVWLFVGSIVAWIITRWQRLLPFFRMIGFVLGKIFEGLGIALVWVFDHSIKPIIDAIGAILDGLLWVVEWFFDKTLSADFKKQIGLNFNNKVDISDKLKKKESDKVEIKFNNLPENATVDDKNAPNSRITYFNALAWG